jgi:hypothetical protein
VTLIITTCTNRKRRPVSDGLHMGTLASARIPELAAEWASRLTGAATRFPAMEIYGGRSFREAVLTAETLTANLMVVSAGLGLIYASTKVPAYACTIAMNADDSVSSRIDGSFSAAAWWAALRERSPFRVALHEAARQQDGLIFGALSEAYLEMTSAEFLALPDATLSRLRLFTRAPLDRVTPGLRPYVMPYDDRLDGPDSPVPGTLSDFASRALRHFAGLISDDIRSAAYHASTVSSALAGWRYPTKVSRVRYDDAGLLALMREHWDCERGFSLERLRHEFNAACEQGRFAALVRIIRNERHGLA